MWQTIEYTNAIYDEVNRHWISSAEVAEVDFTAFVSKKKSEQVTGRLAVRRIPELNPKDVDAPTLFDTYLFHPFFTTSTLDTVTADKVHRQHAVIEQVNADMKNSALAHLPSGKIDESDDSNGQDQTGQCPSTGCFIGPPNQVASAQTVAVGDGMDEAIHRRECPTWTGCGLTDQP